MHIGSRDPAKEDALAMKEWIAVLSDENIDNDEMEKWEDN